MIGQKNVQKQMNEKFFQFLDLEIATPVYYCR